MKKSERELIFNKCNGNCAYCGCALNKSFHVDHIEPVHRYQKYVTDDKGNRIWDSEKRDYKTISIMDSPHNDNIANCFPSCASCNGYKHSNSLEGFRKAIEEQPRKLRAASPMLRLSERYGIVQIFDKPVVFYFETLNSLTTQ